MTTRTTASSTTVATITAGAATATNRPFRYASSPDLGMTGATLAARAGITTVAASTGLG